LAPWYSFEISQIDFKNFPSDVNLIMQLYDKDVVNDHRMGIDIFENISISDSLKDCIIVLPDTVESFYCNGSSENGLFEKIYL